MIFRITREDLHTSENPSEDEALVFNMLTLPPELEAEINALCPRELVSKAYDWPENFTGFRGWTDSINSLWWPQGGDNFASCIVVIDDLRNDILARIIDKQKPEDPTKYTQPWIEMVAYLSPEEDGGRLLGEKFQPHLLEAKDQAIEILAWKLYPLAPIRISTATEEDKENNIQGLWLLPLVDVRYFTRNKNLDMIGEYSGYEGDMSVYPITTVAPEDFPDWFPPTWGYPKDEAEPDNYAPIYGIKNSKYISVETRWGTAIDAQAALYCTRIVCRDVKSKYNARTLEDGHDVYSGVLNDYPDLSNPETDLSYHNDVFVLVRDFAKVSGGTLDYSYLNRITPQKLRFVYPIEGTNSTYSVILNRDVDYPTSVNDFTFLPDAPDEEEKLTIPNIVMGITISSYAPDTVEEDGLIASSKEWALHYFQWKANQLYVKFPGTWPLIPNGHAKLIKWDFSPTNFSTTYIALEGVGAVSPWMSGTGGSAGLSFYARIDGEGSLVDNLQGKYAFTQMRSFKGEFIEHLNPIKGYVQGVNGSDETNNPAQDESGKTAVPTGLIVRLRAGAPYIDVETGKIFDHFTFTTTDLSQIIRLKDPPEYSDEGYIGGYVRRFNGTIWEDAEEIWVVLG